MGVVAGLLMIPSAASAKPTPPGHTPTLTAKAVPSPVVFGQSTVVSGRLSRTPKDSGQTVQLQSDPFPYGVFAPGPTMLTAANGNYAFASVRPDRNTLYRVHEQPDPTAVEHLIAKLADLGVPTPPAPERMTPRDAARVAGEASQRIAAYVEQSGRGRFAFPSLVLRALKQARYDKANLGHMGLASVAYCHFTSPIRRYPDLVVHRALLRELGVADDPLPEDLPELAADTSARERAAAAAEYAADAICLAWLLDKTLFDRGWEAPFAGEIIGMIGSGLFARFGDVYEGFLPARLLGGDYYELNALGTALEGRRTGRRFRLGDPIDVRVESIDRAEGKVALRLS